MLKITTSCHFLFSVTHNSRIVHLTANCIFLLNWSPREVEIHDAGSNNVASLFLKHSLNLITFGLRITIGRKERGSINSINDTRDTMRPRS